LFLDHFIKIYSRKLKKNIKGFSPDALNILLKYDWPGNVRELENNVERCVALCSSSLIVPSDITANLHLDGSREGEIYQNIDLSLKEKSESHEKECILVSLIKKEKQKKRGWGGGEKGRKRRRRMKSKRGGFGFFF